MADFELPGIDGDDPCRIPTPAFPFGLDPATDLAWRCFCTPDEAHAGKNEQSRGQGEQLELPDAGSDYVHFGHTGQVRLPLCATTNGDNLPAMETAASLPGYNAAWATRSANNSGVACVVSSTISAVSGRS